MSTTLELPLPRGLVGTFIRCSAALLLAALAGCAELGDLAGPAPEGSYPGFDTSLYPGDAAMRTWSTASPYRWVGYYLQAPCHRDASWMGKRATLQEMGWGMALLYVGQQTWDGVQQLSPNWNVMGVEAAGAATCSRELLTAAQGTAEAADAVSKTANEGFPSGTIIFLDVERMETIPASMQAYYRAWIRGVLADGRFQPGVYAHRHNATALYAAAREVYAAAGRSGAPEFWIAGGSGFSLARHPTDVGFDFASVWQGALDISETWGGVRIRIDANVAGNRSPSSSAP
jgi:hypothetical protein